MRGLVVWFRGSFGFISDNESGKEYFVHWTAIESEDKHKALNAGDKVEFNIATRDGKTICTNVRREVPIGSRSHSVQV